MLNRDPVLEAFLEAQKNSLRNVSMRELIENFLHEDKDKQEKAYIELCYRLYMSSELDEDEVRDLRSWVLKIESTDEVLSDPMKILCASFWSRCPNEDTSGDFKKADLYIRGLIQQNHPQALAIQAHIYRYKTREYQKTFEYYQKAAGFGNALAHCVLGIAYRKGFLGENETNSHFLGKDHKTAFEHCQTGFGLGYYYSNSGLVYVAHGDYAKAIEEYERSASAGSPIALACLGSRYYQGKINQDFDKALRYTFYSLSFWIDKASKKAAENNIPIFINSKKIDGKLLLQYFNEGIVPSYLYEKLNYAFEKLYSYVSVMLPLDDRIQALRNLLDQNQAMSKVVLVEKLPVVRGALNAAAAERDKVFFNKKEEKQPVQTSSVDSTLKPAASAARKPMDPEFLLKTYQQWEPLKQIAERPLIDLVKTFVDPNTDFLTRDRIYSALMDNTEALESLRSDEMKKWITETEEKSVISDLERAILSGFYSCGIIVKKDLQKAYDFVKKAVDQENPFILYRQSRHLYYGTGVTEDLPMSFTNALRAAAQNLSLAKSFTGYYRDNHGEKIAESLLKAREEYEDGILLGETSCLFNFVATFGGTVFFKVRCYKTLMLTTNDPRIKNTAEMEFLKLLTGNLSKNELYKIFNENLLPKAILSKIKNKKSVKKKIFSEIQSLPLSERIPALSNALNIATPIGQLMWHSRKLTAAKLKKGTLKNLVIELIAALRMAHEQRLQLTELVPAIQWCIIHKDEHKVDLKNLPEILKIAKRVEVPASSAAKEAVRENIARDMSHPISSADAKNGMYPALPADREKIPVPVVKPDFHPPYPNVDWQKPVVPTVDEMLSANQPSASAEPVLRPEIKLYDVAQNPHSFFVYTNVNSKEMQELRTLPSPVKEVTLVTVSASEPPGVEDKNNSRQTETLFAAPSHA